MLLSLADAFSIQDQRRHLRRHRVVLLQQLLRPLWKDWGVGCGGFRHRLDLAWTSPGHRLEAALQYNFKSHPSFSHQFLLFCINTNGSDPLFAGPKDILPTCQTCSVTLKAENQSALPTFCKLCFRVEHYLSAAGQPKQDVSMCAICAHGISADTKSPYPGFCFSCYQDQARIEDAIADLQAQPDLTPLAPPDLAPLPPPEASPDSEKEDETEDECCPKLTLPEGYTHEQLIKDFVGVSSSPEVIASHDQERWTMYGRAALLLENGVYRSALQAEERCQKLSLNRNKLSKVRAMLKMGNLPAECPEDFRIGQNPTLTLTQQEKLDLHGVVRFHAKSSLSLSVPQIKRIIVALRMSKAGLFDDNPPLEVQRERVDQHFAKYDTTALWKNFRSWSHKTQEKADWLFVKSMKQKNVAEVSALTPDTVVKAMVELQSTLLEMGIAEKIGDEVVVKQSEAYRITTCDEKGL